MTTTVQKTVGALATQSIEIYLRRVESYEKPVLQDRDPENLHQMRVNLRRLRTVIQVFSPGIILPKAGREPQVAAIARKLSQLRDLDVIAAILREQYSPDLPAIERDQLKVAFDYLAKHRKKAYKRVKATLKGDRYQTLKTSLHQWVLNPDCNSTARLSIDIVLADLTLPLISHLWLHPGWLVEVKSIQGQFIPNTQLSVEDMDALAITHSEVLHNLRKQVKRVRYQLKLVSELYGDRLKEHLSKIADLQAVLGTMQDTNVMGDFVDHVLPDWEKRLPTLKALLANSRHRAWQQWQPLQQYYLELKNREALRQLLMNPEVDANVCETSNQRY